MKLKRCTLETIRHEERNQKHNVKIERVYEWGESNKGLGKSIKIPNCGSHRERK